jgi:hypothetical protein
VPASNPNQNPSLNQNKTKKNRGFVGMNKELKKSQKPKTAQEVSAARKANVKLSRKNAKEEHPSRTNSTRDREEE